jgi:hypothetical protein
VWDQDYALAVRGAHAAWRFIDVRKFARRDAGKAQPQSRKCRRNYRKDWREKSLLLAHATRYEGRGDKCTGHKQSRHGRKRRHGLIPQFRRFAPHGTVEGIRHVPES